VRVWHDLHVAGHCGLVLTVGMAVDANVLIYERIREESGKASHCGARSPPATAGHLARFSIPTSRRHIVGDFVENGTVQCRGLVWR